jgi:hypothetical protein
MNIVTIAEFKRLCKALTEIAAVVREETNEVVATKDHVQVIRHYDEFRKINAVIKETKDALSKMEERLSREQVPDVMRLSNIRSTTIEGVGRVSLGTRWSASMIDKDMGMKWLRDNGNGGVIQETVNAQTLGALAKELNDQGIDLPSDKFSTNIMTYTSITKAI